MTRSLLLDTCALLWLGNAPERFSAQAISEIESAPILYASPIFQLESRICEMRYVSNHVACLHSHIF